MSIVGTALMLMVTSPVTLPLHISMQATIEQRIIIRIPTRPTQRPRRRAPSGIVWRERPTDDCQPVSEISRARFTRPGVVDLLMQDRSLVRARLSSECVALGYYSAFYLVPGDDGQICASRDAIVSRAGNECAISGFHRLEPRQND
ncbi:hypothetical protein HFP51_02170 [Parasphingopyxis sp. CP4]|uniref:hypothetical protein n=1 Tax=Parasphingopyxis sp. CP4 TaxID=2724527 RepID=UPI0015A4AA8F|nr:hypothetical protein [Parasphingopyxis sp. CP4]QLC21095.1 hypothetical protein HFP51_02170 [Parasphingopyxis sp. CP4]